MSRVAVSVVIPTKDRPVLLQRCVEAVLKQECECSFEVIIVNDAGCSVAPISALDDRVRVTDGEGRGPGAARNLGIAQASGELVAFTDDDVIPQEDWLQAAVAALRERDAVGVVGRVDSPPWDPLYEHSVRGDCVGGIFLTCNVVYRRSALEAVAGFDTGFPYAHAEDRDLGYRLQEIGTVLYEPRMRVLHPPRPADLGGIVRRGRLIESEWRLHHRHPQTRPPRWSARWGPFVRLARGWATLLRDHHVIKRSPKRATRFALLACAQLGVALAVTVRGPGRSSVPSTDRLGNGAGQQVRGGTEDRPQNGTGRRRVAVVGTELLDGDPRRDPGWRFVEELASRGHAVDWYAGGPDGGLSERLTTPGLRLITFDSGWRPDRWYSRHRVSRALTRGLCRRREQRRLARLRLEQQRFRPYEAVYQCPRTT
jgi:glycosyltransferase involved in cell wall biosynthesis